VNNILVWHRPGSYPFNVPKGVNYIGKSTDSRFPNFIGEIANFAMYQRVLSLAEISGLYYKVPIANDPDLYMDITFAANTVSGVNVTNLATIINPTVAPSTPPTLAPTFAINEIAQFSCIPFSVANSSSYKTCRFISCDGYVAEVSMCSGDTYNYGYCTGDATLAAYDSNGVLLTSNNNYCGKCPVLSFIAHGQCQQYSIRQSCAGNVSCGGTTAVKIINLIPTSSPTTAPSATPTIAPTAIPTITPTLAPSGKPTLTPTLIPTAVPTTSFPTNQPTLAPSATPTIAPTAIPTITPTFVPTNFPTIAPSAIPSFIPSVVPSESPSISPSEVPSFVPSAIPSFVPSAIPTYAPTFSDNEIDSFTCFPYTASNTSNNTMNYQSCRFLACEGFQVKAGLCAADTYGMAECTGDTMLSVFDATGELVSSNDDYCGQCSKLEFAAKGKCQMYTIRQGCFNQDSCGGTVAVEVFLNYPTTPPTVFPNLAPSAPPTEIATNNF